MSCRAQSPAPLIDADADASNGKVHMTKIALFMQIIAGISY